MMPPCTHRAERLAPHLSFSLRRFGLNVIEGMPAGLIPLPRAFPSPRQLMERTDCSSLSEMGNLGSAARQVRWFHCENC